MRTKRIVLYALLIGSICLACRPTSGPPWEQSGAANQEPVEVMLLSFGFDATEEPLVESFMKQYPNINVAAYPAHRWGWGNELVERLRQDAGAGSDDVTIPDVVQAPADFLASLGEEGYLLDLSPFMHEGGSLVSQSFYPELIEPLRLGDQVFVLPMSVNLVMLYYNADLFARKGIFPPTVEWTWDDMLEAAVRIAEPDAVPPIHGLMILDALPFFMQHGASLVDDPWAPKNFTLNSDEMVEAVSWLVDLENFYRVSPSIARMMQREGEAFTTVTEGRVGMWVADMAFRHYVGDGMTWTFSYGVAPLPQGRYRATTGTVQGIAILKNTTTPRESWELLRYLASNLSPGANPISQFPALRSLAESQEFLDRMPEDGVESYEQSLAFLMPPYNLPAGVEWQLNRTLERQLGPIFSEGVDPRVALDAAQREADQMLTPQLMQ